MSASFAADRPRHTRLARLARDRIIAPLPVSVADGMDRRKINDIESHRVGLVDRGQTVAKSRSAIAATFGRAREEFIPSRHLRGGTIDNHARRRRILGGAGALRIGRHQYLEFARMRDLVYLRIVARANFLRELMQ